MVKHASSAGVIRETRRDQVFLAVLLVISAFILVIELSPLIFVVSASFSDSDAISLGRVYLLPVNPSLDGYRMLLKEKDILTGFKNSVIYLAVGTTVNMLLTMLLAFPLSRREMPGRNIITFFVALTMYVSGGLIPGYLNLRRLGFLNTLWVMIIPDAISTGNLLLMRNFFLGMSEELKESAYMDGASEPVVLWKIVLPLSMPIIATMALFYGVSNWNEYSTPLMYNSNDKLHTIQVVLQKMYNNSVQKIQDMDDLTSATSSIATEAVRSATVVFATLPIIMVYPFLQKHFAKGVMVGSLKG